MRRLSIVLATLALGALLVACGDDGESAGTGADGSTIQVTDAWARSPMQDVGAVYLTVHNAGQQEDRLIGVSSTVAGRAEVHETVEQDGVMVMQPAGPVAIAPGEDLVLEPGGYHIMLIDLTEPLEVDSTITVVLEFENAGQIEVQALVKAYVQETGIDMGGEGPTGSTADAGMG